MSSLSPSYTSSRYRSARERSRDRYKSPRRENSRDRYRSYGTDDGYRLHVADVSEELNQREIERAFERFGPLIEVWHAKSSCFAFVVFRRYEDADRALKEMDNRKILSCRIRVSWARPRARNRRRWDPSMRCYICGARGHFSRDCGESGSGRRYRSRSKSYNRSPPSRYGDRGVFRGDRR